MDRGRARPRVDDATLANLGERLLGGVLSAVIVLVTALGRAGRRRGDRPPVPGARPRGSLGQADRLGRIVYATFGSYFAGSMFVAVLAGLVTLSTGLLLGRAVGAGGRPVDHVHQPDPPDRRASSAVGSSCCWRHPGTGRRRDRRWRSSSPTRTSRTTSSAPPSSAGRSTCRRRRRCWRSWWAAAAAGVPGALVATPLFAASKAVYLDRRGEIPPEPEAQVDRVVAAAPSCRGRPAPPAAVAGPAQAATEPTASRARTAAASTAARRRAYTGRSPVAVRVEPWSL